MKKYNIAIAGSTNYTAQCLDTILQDERFLVSWVLTPKPKPRGRKKIITPTPLDVLAKKHLLPTIHVDKKINQENKEKIMKQNKLDFLLVVDFGYFIPSWLLSLPSKAPLNIHPSKLPNWRGSSPAQFSILFNDQTSAVSVIKMNDKLDQGAIIFQQNFDIKPSWTQKEYYDHAFNLVNKDLTSIILNYKKETKQPSISPTVTARTIKKNDAFISWQTIKQAMKNIKNNNELKSPLLAKALEQNKSLALTIERASKAFSPWPILWTVVPTSKGDKRMKLLSTKVINNKLVLDAVQLEGKNPSKYNEIKNTIQASSNE